MKTFFKKYIGVLLLALCLAPQAVAQVTVNASIDSLELYIGEQAKVKLEVSCPTESQLVMPVYTDLLMPGVEFVKGYIKSLA